MQKNIFKRIADTNLHENLKLDINEVKCILDLNVKIKQNLEKNTREKSR